MTSNICRANFNGGRTAQGNNRFQWDYGQILEISGIANLPDPFVAQFSNTPVLGTAKSTVGTGGRVEIPNEYFLSGQNIYCFIVLHTGEDDGRTVYIATIPVTKRPKPIDDPITPTQQSTIDTAIAALQAGVAKAEGFAQTATEQAGIATEAATTATEAATRAEGAVADVEAAATRAETAADGAEASATAAEASATGAESAKTAAQAAKDAAETAAASAEQSATDAGNYAGLAEAAETSAAASATAAEASATAAAGSASAASGSATQAAQKASEASASATAAGTSATNAEAAKTGAETAQTAAETAQASAEEAAANAEQSAETAEWYAERVERFLPTDTASGEIASFPDGADGVPMQSVVVSMEPIQDLHGYDHPWPAGGGKNVVDFKAALDFWNATYTENEDGSFTVRDIGSGYTRPYQFASEDATYTMSAVSIINGSSASGWGVDFVNASGGSTGAIREGSLVSQGKTACKIRLNYGRPGAGFTIKNIQIEAGSTATDFAPYSNICPISGRTGADIEHTGVNVWDEEWESGRINVTSGASISGNGIRSGFIPILPSTTYFGLRGDYADASGIIFCYYDAEKNYLSYENKFGLSALFTTPTNARYLRFNIMTSAAVTTYNHDISINYPATDTAYHAYTGDTISVSWESEAGTVYGGTLDVVSGELVVDRAMVDLGTLNWTRLDNKYFRALMALTNGKVVPNSVTANLLCSQYTAVTGRSIALDTAPDKTVATEDTNPPSVRVKDTAYTNAATFKAAMSGVQLVYELASPIIYHLTPQEMRTLLGANNVWSDAGDTAVTYKADVQLYIDKRISALS